MDEETEMKVELPEHATTQPLIAAAKRLERLLGGGLQSKNQTVHTYTNPAKVVRRWLGTASGAAGSATSDEIVKAAVALLDPSGECSSGRSLLSTGVSAYEMAASDEERVYLTAASCREIESWLISLMVRCLRKEGKIAEAYKLSEKGIETIVTHLTVASPGTVAAGVSTTSLFPLLARMYRYRSLCAASMGDQNLSNRLRADMAKAHNMACVRRDVDCQATLLNLMLEDLIVHSQSKYATETVEITVNTS